MRIPRLSPLLCVALGLSACDDPAPAAVDARVGYPDVAPVPIDGVTNVDVVTTDVVDEHLVKTDRAKRGLHHVGNRHGSHDCREQESEFVSQHGNDRYKPILTILCADGVAANAFTSNGREVLRRHGLRNG